MADSVRNPSHYDGAHGVDCAEAMANMVDRHMGLTGSESYWWATALKYLWRWPLKNGREDLDKAVECIRRLMAEEYGEDEEEL